MAIAALLLAGTLAPLRAQEAPVTELAQVMQADEAADRAAIRQLFARPEVQRAAKVGGIDLQNAESRLDGLGGEQLHRAATQARALDGQIEAAQGEIRISTITLIIVLLLVVIIILIA